MREKILILSVFLLIINALWGWLNPSIDNNYEYERDKYQELQNDIKSIYKEIENNKSDIKTFKDKINAVDSIYSDIDKSGLRKRSNDIFRRHVMLYTK